MSEFKVGDKVIIGKGHHLFQEGEEIKIIEVDHQDVECPYKCSRANGEWSWVKVDKIKSLVSKPSKNQRITALEERVAELEKAMAEQIELNEKQIRFNDSTLARFKEVVAGLSSTEDEVIEFEGAKYRKVDRLAREGDVAIVRETAGVTVEINTPYKVVIDNQKIPHLMDTYFAQVYDDIRNRTPETVDVYELIVEDKQDVQCQTVDCDSELPFDDVDLPYEPTPNELRAEIIEKAKQFIESSKTTVSGKVENGTEKGKVLTFENVYSVREVGIGKTACNAEFVVNEEKRTIVALLRGVDTNKIYHRGIAKCNPSDVYNEHIGRAIALGRALNLDVSEFEQAVQPTIPVKGMYCKHHVGCKGQLTQLRSDGQWVGTEGLVYGSHPVNLKIINDTNAQYGGVE